MILEHCLVVVVEAVVLSRHVQVLDVLGLVAPLGGQARLLPQPVKVAGGLVLAQQVVA